MGNSRIPGPVGTRHGAYSCPESLPGPLGIDVNHCHRDSAGAVGLSDWGGFLASRHLARSRAAALSAAATAPASRKCACNRDLTLDELHAVFPQAKRTLCAAYLPLINKTCGAYEISTCLRKAHFLAQIANESSELRHTAEQLGKGKTEEKVYGGYKGRGLMQLTLRKNYELYGAYVRKHYAAYGTDAHHDFLGEHRIEIEKPEWAADSAGWYWVHGNKESLNTLADKNDLLAITAIVNGAFNGFDDRRRHLAAAQDALHVRDCSNVSIGIETFCAFSRSEIYNNAVRSFAWGCWNDPKGGKSGVMKSAESRKEGYRRYLQLTDKAPASASHAPPAPPPPHAPHASHVPHASHHHDKHKAHLVFGFTHEQMHSMAVEGSK